MDMPLHSLTTPWFDRLIAFFLQRWKERGWTLPYTVPRLKME
jgi:hypothetical protein